MSSKTCQLCFSELPNEAIVCRSCGRYQINLEQEYRRVAFKKLLAADRKIGESLPDRFVRNYSLGYYKIAYTVVSTILGLAVFLLLVQPPLKESGWWPVAFYIVAPLFYFLGWWVYEKYRKEYYERRCNNTVLDYVVKLKNELEPVDLLTFSNDDLSDRLRALEHRSSNILGTMWLWGIILIFILTNPKAQDFSNTSFGKNGGFGRLDLIICSIYTTNANQSYFGVAGNFYKM